MATIYDIAKLTGYSPSTVSKVFRGYRAVGEEPEIRLWKRRNRRVIYQNIVFFMRHLCGKA